MAHSAGALFEAANAAPNTLGDSAKSSGSSQPSSQPSAQSTQSSSQSGKSKAVSSVKPGKSMLGTMFNTALQTAGSKIADFTVQAIKNPSNWNGDTFSYTDFSKLNKKQAAYARAQQRGLSLDDWAAEQEKKTRDASTRVQELKDQIESWHKDSRGFMLGSRYAPEDDIGTLEAQLRAAERVYDKANEEWGFANEFKEAQGDMNWLDQSWEHNGSYANIYSGINTGITTLEGKRDALERQLNEMQRGALGGMSNMLGGNVEDMNATDRYRQMNDIKAEIEKLNKTIDTAKRRRDLAQSYLGEDPDASASIASGRQKAQADAAQFSADRQGWTEEDWNAWQNNTGNGLGIFNKAVTGEGYQQQAVTQSAIQPTDEWTKEQEDQYYLLYDKYGAKEAANYAANLNSAYNRQRVQEQTEGVRAWAADEDASGYGKRFREGAGVAAQVALAPAHMISWLDKLNDVKMNGGYYTGQREGVLGGARLVDYGNALVQGNTERLNKLGTISEDNKILGDILGGKGLGDLYQLGTSIAQSMAYGNVVGEGATLFLFFGQAADSGFDEAIDRGASPDQAALYSVLAGTAEVAGEKFSLENLLDPTKAAMRSTLKNILVQGGIEGSEEGFTDLLNLFNDALSARLTGGRTEIQQKLAEYMSSGMSYDEAAKKVWKETAADVAWDVVGGAISGGVSGGMQTAVREVTPYKADNEGRTAFGADTSQLAKEALATDDKKLQQRAQKAQQKADAGKTISVAEAGRLVKGTNRAAVVDAVENQIKSRDSGVENARSLANAVVAQSRGEKLSQNQKKLIENNKDLASSLIRDLDTRNPAAWARNIGVRGEEAKVYGSRSEKNFAEDMRATKETMTVRVNGNESTIIGATRDEKGKVTAYKVQSGDGKVTEVKAEDVSMREGQKAVADIVTGGAYAEQKLKSIEKGRNLKEYSTDFDIAADVFGNSNSYKTFDEAWAAMQKAGTTLTKDQARAAWEAGQQQKASTGKPTLKRRGTGAVSFDEFNDGTTTYDKPSAEDIEAFKQTARYQVLTDIAKAIGVDLSFFKAGDSKVNGMYQNGTVYLNMDASYSTKESAENYIMLTAAHELTHYIREASPSAYAELKDFVVKHIIEAGKLPNGNTLTEQIKHKLGVYGYTISVDDAVEEIVADACQMMLKDNKLVATMAAENKDLHSKIGKWMQKFFRKLANAFRGISVANAGSTEARAMEDAFKELQEIWNRGLSAAAELDTEEHNAEVDQRVADGKAITPEDENKYSLRYDDKLMADAYEMNRKTHAVSDKVMLQAQRARQYIAGEFMSDERNLNLPADVMGNTFLPDMSYGGTMENTTVCIRSLAAQALMDQISKKLGRPMTVDETLMLSQEIANWTDKPECFYCYVATDRRAYREFLGNYDQQRQEVLEKASKLSDEERQAILDMGKAPKKANRKNAAKNLPPLYKEFLNGRADTDNMRNRIKLWVGTPQAELISSSDLASLDELAKELSELEQIENKTPEQMSRYAQLKDAAGYAQSASWAKKNMGYTAYDGKILSFSDEKVKSFNDHYGLRMYSFSDFSAAFILENMQMITDAAARGLKMLAYTKEMAFAEIFAPTGININISVYASMDNGQIIRDEMMGANWEKAIALREKYNNVGLTLVATNDEIVKWGMEQPYVDVIIPYHLVRTGKAVADYFGFTNYTSESADGKILKAREYKGKVTSISPTMHNNDVVQYARALQEHKLTPRFGRWLNGFDDFLNGNMTEADFRAANPNYMKLVNETRQTAGETKPVQPVFNVGAALDSIDEMEARGGYGIAEILGPSYESTMQEISNKVVGQIQGRKLSLQEQEEAEIEQSDVNTKYSIREGDPPKKTMIGYKVFKVDAKHPGQLYPTKVKNPGGQGTPLGVWLNADTGELARNPDGSIKTNSRGRIAVQADGGTLAWRPGWHLGSLPEANQMNRVDPNNPNSDNSNRGVTGLMWDNYVFCECEFAADEDYQLEAFEYGTDEKGRYNHTQAGLPYIPRDGYYKYRTNPDPSTAPWFISGAIKITKILDDDMRREIIEKWNAEHPDEQMRFTERYSGGKIDLTKYGLEAGPVKPSKNLDKVAPAVDYSEEIRNLPGYTRHALNFNDPKVQEAFRIQQIEDKKDSYIDLYNRTHKAELEGAKLSRKDVAGFSGNVYNEVDLNNREREAIRSTIMQKYNNSLPERGYAMFGDKMYVFSGDDGDATITGKYKEADIAEAEDEIRRLYNGQSNGGYETFDSVLKVFELNRRRHKGRALNTRQSGKRLQANGTNLQSRQSAQLGGTSYDGRVHQKVLNGLYEDLFEVAEYRNVKPRDYIDAYKDLKYQVERKMIGPKEVLHQLEDMIDEIESFGGGGKYSIQDNGSAKYSFAGVDSQTADKSLLNRAQQMEQEGRSSEEIRQETGWFRGMDNVWRYEINDQGLKVLPGFDPTAEGVTLADLIKHDELFAAYPQLRDIKIKVGDYGSTEAMYTRWNNTISLNNSLLDDKKKLRSVLAHEIQHAIQRIEGFATGASPEYWRSNAKGMRDYLENRVAALEQQTKKAASELDEIYEKIGYDDYEKQLDGMIWMGEISEAEADEKLREFVRERSSQGYALQELYDTLSKEMQTAKRALRSMPSAFGLYERTAGEIEASDVQKRLSYGEAKRMANRPNIDRDDVVFARFSVKDETDVTDRELLANTLYSVVKNPAEKTRLTNYKKRLDEFYETRDKLAEADAVLRAARHTGDKEAIRKAQAERNRLNAKLVQIDSKLTELELTKPLKELLSRVRQDTRARQRAMTAERRTKTDLRHKIRSLHDSMSRQLLQPKGNRYVPKDLLRSVAELLEAVNTDTGRSETVKAKLAELNAQYAKIAESNDYGYAFDDTVAEMIQKLTEELAGMDNTSIYKMSRDQLQLVYDTMKAINHTVRKAVFLVNYETNKNIFEIAQGMMKETDSASPVNLEMFNKWLNASLRPETFFKRMAGYRKNSNWNMMADMLNTAQHKQTQIQMEGTAIFEELMKDTKALDAMTDHKQLYDIGLKDKNGEAVPVTMDMALMIYLHTLNEQNTRHLIYGGLTVPNMKKYYKGKASEAYAKGNVRVYAYGPQLADLGHQLRTAETDEEKEQIQAQIDALEEKAIDWIAQVRQNILQHMGEYEHAWVKAAQKFFNEYSNRVLNETTMAVYGFEKATVENYAPIHTDAAYRTATFDSISRDMSLENSGFMKSRIVGAANPMLAEGIVDVIALQIDNVAKYAAMMPAVRNFQKVYGKSASGYTGSIQESVRSKFGNSALKYIENIITDLTSPRRTEGGLLGEYADKLRGNLAAASLTLSPRVTLGQAASYPTAAAVIGWKPLVKALKEVGSNPMYNEEARQEIAKWSPLMWYRMQGFFDQSVGEGRGSAVGKAMDKVKFLTGWIEAVDGWTVGQLWYAAQAYVEDNTSLSRGTDAFMEETAKVFNRIVEQTQPNYTTFQRPDILRNPNAIVKQLTMFMTQRLQNVNILFDAVGEYNAAVKDYRSGGKYGTTVEDLKQAKLGVVRAVTSQLAAAATITAFKFLADAIMYSMKAYRDDDDELTAESITNKLLQNWMESMASNFLWGSELYAFAKSMITGERYYGVSLNGIDTFNKMLKDFTNLRSEPDGAKLWALCKDAAQVLGIPLNNLSKFYNAVAFRINDVINDEDWGSYASEIQLTDEKRGAQLYKALVDGNTDKARKIYDYFGNKADANEQVTKYIKSLYADDELTSKEAEKALQKYADVSAYDSQLAVSKLTCEKDTGIKYDDIKGEYLKGNITEEKAADMRAKYGMYDQEDAEATVLQWKMEKDTGFTYDDMPQYIAAGDMTKEQAVKYRVKYGGQDEDAATKTVAKWMCEIETGIPYSKIESHYAEGVITKDTLISYYMKYGLYDEAKAINVADKREFIGTDDALEDASLAAVAGYYGYCDDADVDKRLYLDAYQTCYAIRADKDSKGKTISGSALKKKLAYINSLELTSQQKTAVALAIGITDSQMKKWKAPWK